MDTQQKYCSMGYGWPGNNEIKSDRDETFIQITVYNLSLYT